MDKATLTNAEKNQTAEVILNGETLTVRVLLSDGGELTGWTFDYEAEGFEPGYAADAASYEVARFERNGYTQTDYTSN
ncbi:gp19.2 [Streptomyces phage phiBT1]|uniref:Gp19.2 n=1 Tax=Lomovskayavirus BT1 TaxID=225588 RepID=Q858Y2_9CAUD|nr:gp19.2 [Streptomyces phage phiBT1]CAD80143.1 gp19.2 [Lomovskayavirus BT1]